MEEAAFLMRGAAFHQDESERLYLEEKALALREIILEGDPVLRKKAREVDKITPHILTLLDDMAETMYEANGVGLAAPQISVKRRVVVIDIGDGLIEMINPQLISTEGTQRNAEGCLSLPEQSGYVDRPQKVVVEALNRDGDLLRYEAEGYLAIAMCHEIDHLEGILFTDKVLDLTEEEIAELRRRDMEQHIIYQREMDEQENEESEQSEAE